MGAQDSFLLDAYSRTVSEVVVKLLQASMPPEVRYVSVLPAERAAG